MGFVADDSYSVPRVSLTVIFDMIWLSPKLIPPVDGVTALL